MLRKTDLKGYVPHDFIYVCGFLERQNYFISGCQAKGPQGTFGVTQLSVEGSQDYIDYLPESH